MKTFQKVNNITGWIIFLISFVVYTLTVEETASFWDCGEFIAVSYKLMVPHPPGAPLFLLIGRVFSFFAMGDVLRVAYWVNMLSVVSSAFTILFLFWSIVLLGRKIMKPLEDGSYTQGQTISLMLAGAVGALAYTFSDSFWFSAVEAEVYAMSSFFTAIVLWAMLKWDLITDPRKENQWLILITYIMGLSIGVHLLNLVMIPALGMIYYYKKFPEFKWSTFIMVMVASFGIIGVVMVGVIPGLPSIAGWFEVLFVNSFGLPFSFGAAFFVLLLLGGLSYGIFYAQKTSNVMLSNALLGFAFILIGYSSYSLVLIRSNFNTPIDENNPEDIMSFVSYLKREQYGDRPLLFGPSFTTERTGAEKTSPIYKKGKDKYEIVDYKTKAVYGDKGQMLLPRMHSQQGGHDQLYRNWTGLKPNETPTFSDNIYYMFKYQFGHMYYRYFMWNFAGRESDEKDSGYLTPFADSGDALPYDLARNKGRSNFYMLPLIIGLLGMFFHYNTDKKNFWMVMMAFFLTGLGVVLYLNSPPVEPRERDYIYVGSFYAFAIWIGFGMLAISDLLQKIVKSPLVRPVVAGVLAMSAPVVMAVNGWDNHDRSNRWHSVDQARNTLASLAPNAILFTGGDNDTFPLWYVQEVEGFRTDVRVVVLSYLSTDWYIGQMKRNAYESEPLPIEMPIEIYRQGKNDYLPLVEDPKAKNGVLVPTYIKYVGRDDKSVQVPLQGGSFTTMLVSKRFVLPVDVKKVKSMGFVPKHQEDQIQDKMIWELKQGRNAMFKNELAILDMLAHNNWERPIYFNNTSSNNIAMNLQPFLQLEGMAYRLMPIRNEGGQEEGVVNIEVMLENIKKFQYRGFDDPSTYNDDEYKKFGANQRNLFHRLAMALFREDRDAEAIEVLDMALEKIPDSTVPYSYFIPRYVQLYHLLGEHEKAEELAAIVTERAIENLTYVDKKGSTTGVLGVLEQQSTLTLNQFAYGYRRLEAMNKARKQALVLDSAMTEEERAAEAAKIDAAQKIFEAKAKEYYQLFGQYAGNRR